MDKCTRDFKRVTESSISRVFQHIEEPERSFGVISAFRQELSDAENVDRHRALIRDVRALGLGYVEMRGTYTEDGVTSQEKSLFVPTMTKKQVMDLGIKYGQDTVIFKDADEFIMVSTGPRLGVGVVDMRFQAGAGRSNLELAQSAMKEFFSNLLKGSHSGHQFQFKAEEKVDTGYYTKAYGRGDTTPWVTLYEETVGQ